MRAQAFGLAGLLHALTTASAGVLLAAPIKGPHLQDVRPDGVTIVWEQQVAGPGTVTVGSQQFASSAAKMLHEVKLTGLSPGTQHSYSVQADGATKTGSFTTAPATPTAPFTFVIFGDNRSDTAAHTKVVNAIVNEGPIAFAINTGDMVSSGEIASDWQTFFDIEQPLIGNTPWYPVVGNHEEYNGQLPTFFSELFAPPSAVSGTEAYYSFTYANTAFVVLDGHVNAVDQMFGLWTDFDAKQQTFVKSALAQHAANATIQHIFVLNHEPPYSSKAGRTGNHAVRLLLPLFEQYEVDAIFSGHDHYLERGESPDGMRYWIMGGGGAPLYANESEGKLGFKPAMAIPFFDDAHTVHFAKSAHGYARISIENGKVAVQVKDAGGSVLDTLSWTTGNVDAGAAGTGGTASSDSGAGAAGQPATGGAAGTSSTGGNAGSANAGSGATSSGGGSGGSVPDASVAGQAGSASTPTDVGSGSEGDCGCRSPGARQARAFAPLALALLLLLGRRRRAGEQDSDPRRGSAPHP